MNRNLLRLIAVLLVQALLMDPVTASAFTCGQPHGQQTPLSLPASRFGTQALSARGVSESSSGFFPKRAKLLTFFGLGTLGGTSLLAHDRKQPAQDQDVKNSVRDRLQKTLRSDLQKRWAKEKQGRQSRRDIDALVDEQNQLAPYEKMRFSQHPVRDLSPLTIGKTIPQYPDIWKDKPPEKEVIQKTRPTPPTTVSLVPPEQYERVALSLWDRALEIERENLGGYERASRAYEAFYSMSSLLTPGNVLALFVAIDARGAIVGARILMPPYIEPYVDPEPVVIGGVAVRTQNQNQGIGTQLHLAAFHWMVEHGYFQYAAYIDNKNKASKDNLYKVAQQMGVVPRAIQDPKYVFSFHVLDFRNMKPPMGKDPTGALAPLIAGQGREPSEGQKASKSGEIVYTLALAGFLFGILMLEYYLDQPISNLSLLVILSFFQYSAAIASKLPGGDIATTRRGETDWGPSYRLIPDYFVLRYADFEEALHRFTTRHLDILEPTSIWQRRSAKAYLGPVHRLAEEFLVKTIARIATAYMYPIDLLHFIRLRKGWTWSPDWAIDVFLATLMLSAGIYIIGLVNVFYTGVFRIHMWLIFSKISISTLIIVTTLWALIRRGKDNRFSYSAYRIRHDIYETLVKARNPRIPRTDPEPLMVLGWIIYALELSIFDEEKFSVVLVLLEEWLSHDAKKQIFAGVRLRGLFEPRIQLLLDHWLEYDKPFRTRFADRIERIFNRPIHPKVDQAA